MLASKHTQQLMMTTCLQAHTLPALLETLHLADMGNYFWETVGPNPDIHCLDVVSPKFANHPLVHLRLEMRLIKSGAWTPATATAACLIVVMAHFFT